MSKVYWTIEDIEEKSGTLGTLVEKSGFTPDMVIGIKFGGHIVGVRVAQILKTPYASINIKRRLSTYMAQDPERYRRFKYVYAFLENIYYRLSKPFIEEPLTSRIKPSQKVLLVDDDIVLSKTINLAKQHLVNKGATLENLKVAALNIHPNLREKPSYFVETVDAIFPWSMYSPHYEAFKKTRYAADRV